MALTAAQFQAWLESGTAIRCLLVEVVANVVGTETTLYLSNRNFNTGPSDTPANTHYQPIVQTSLSFNQSLPLDGAASLSFGDIAIDNTNGDRDSWLEYIWANREINVYIGDVSSVRADFTKIYSGYVQDIASSSRNTLNLSIRDSLQRLNTPVSSTLVGGTGQNSGQLRPLVFGEVHNITPILLDAPNLVYMVHNGPIERIIEVRDNGIPLSDYTVSVSAGTFQLNKAPAGAITCSVQGEHSSIDRLTGNIVSHPYSPANFSWTRAGTTATITHTAHGFSNGASVNITDISATTTIPRGTYTISGVTANTYSITCLSPENLLTYSEGLDNAAWVKSNSTITANIAQDINGIATADKVIDSVSNTTHYVSQVPSFSASTAQEVSFSVYLKAAELNSVRLEFVNTGAFSTSRYVTLNCSTNVFSNPSGVLTYTSEYATNDWYRVTITATTDTSGAVTARLYLVSGGAITFIGTGSSGIYAWGAQLNVGSIANPYFKNTDFQGTPSGSGTISSYANTVSEIIQIIVQKYGTNPLTLSSIDLPTFNTFNLDNQQPVGIYLTSNTNVIALCQELAASIGSQFTSNRQGLVTLLKLTTPTSSTVSITDNDILAGSCSIERKVLVQGAIKLGYCRNWTLQTQLLTGIPEDHKTMLGLEYLTSVVTDSVVLNNYNLSQEPQVRNTYLISNTPIAYVTNEASRLLSLWSIPRFVIKLEATAKFLTLNLGDMVSLTHYRFGLSGSKYGQVVSIATNWDTGRVNLGILV